MLIKSNRICGYTDINSDIQIKLGAIFIEIYSLATKDLCELIISYRKLYIFRDSLSIKKTYLDELIENTNVELKIIYESIQCRAFDSVINSKNSIIKSKPFSVVSLPSGSSKLSKQGDILTIHLFDFIFSTNKPTSYTLLFVQVLYPVLCLANEIRI